MPLRIGVQLELTKGNFLVCFFTEEQKGEKNGRLWLGSFHPYISAAKHLHWGVFLILFGRKVADLISCYCFIIAAAVIVSGLGALFQFFVPLFPYDHIFSTPSLPWTCGYKGHHACYTWLQFTNGMLWMNLNVKSIMGRYNTGSNCVFDVYF